MKILVLVLSLMTEMILSSREVGLMRMRNWKMNLFVLPDICQLWMKMTTLRLISIYNKEGYHQGISSVIKLIKAIHQLILGWHTVGQDRQKCKEISNLDVIVMNMDAA